MLFPEALYQLSARDQQITWLDPRIEEPAVTAAAAVTIEHPILRVPDAYVFLGFSVSVRGSPGAGQTVQRLQVSIRTPGNATTPEAHLIHEEYAALATVPRIAATVGRFLVPPGWRVHAAGVFDAGVAVNTVSGNVSGILVPVGNIARI